jgi:RNA polymerase sigma-70 factor (ECF subfamily)
MPRCHSWRPIAATPPGPDVRDTTLTELERLAVEADAADVTFEMDEDAFRAFYDRTARALWGYLSRVTGDRQLADDLLQEAYYRFLRASRNYESESHRRNSLFQIATNLARDVRRRPLTLQLPESYEASSMRVGGDLAERTAERADLSRAMAQLKPRERQLLWLAYAQGESHRDIAATLGLKTASIKLLLFRARRKLAAILTAGRA